MHPILLGIAASALKAGIQMLCNRPKPERYTQVSWSSKFFVSIPAVQAANAVHEFLHREHRCHTEEWQATRQIFVRGDRSITELPIERQVRWREVPMTIQLDYAVESELTIVSVRFAAPEEMQFDQSAVRTFHECASREFDTIFERLVTCVRDFQEADSGPEAASDLADAYAALNLKPGSSWAEVQAAYREGCKMYHPDTLSRQKLPPHLLELAVKQFKVITEAYQTLKRHLSN